MKLADLAMSTLSFEIRRSDNWWKDFRKEDFREKWTDAALRRAWHVRAPSLTSEVLLSRKQVESINLSFCAYL